MKRALFLLLAIFFAMQGWSQTTLNEGFEGTLFPPDDWIANHVSGSVSWGRYTSEGPRGTACASVNWASASHENWLITPRLQPQVGQNLTFYVKCPSYYDNTTLHVKISTTDVALSSFTTTALTLIDEDITTSWTQKTINLSAFSGQIIYVAFQVVDA
ncbi:MAG: choice-of-anchor J domain-containing protein, partial [Bacteroidales bacterium]|nr:choice-of-anchor J domain-containing protein [Bacteroidales bacterium]